MAKKQDDWKVGPKSVHLSNQRPFIVILCGNCQSSKEQQDPGSSQLPYPFIPTSVALLDPIQRVMAHLLSNNVFLDTILISLIFLIKASHIHIG